MRTWKQKLEVVFKKDDVDRESDKDINSFETTSE